MLREMFVLVDEVVSLCVVEFCESQSVSGCVPLLGLAFLALASLSGENRDAV